MSKTGRIVVAGLFALVLVALWLGYIVTNSPLLQVEQISTTQTQQRPKLQQVTPEPNEVISSDITRTPEGLTTLNAPHWLFNDNIKSHIDELEAAATKGDSEAAFILGMNLQFCFYAPASSEALNQALADAATFSDATAAIARVESKFQYCKDATRDAGIHYYDYLEQAAASGHVFAQQAIGNIYAPRYMTERGFDELSREDFIATRDAFLTRQRQYLQQAAEHGSLPALTRLARMHNAQQTGADGYLNAFALNQVVLALTDDNDIYNRYDGFQQRLLQYLAPEEQARAYQLTEALLLKINANGTLVPLVN